MAGSFQEVSGRKGTRKGERRYLRDRVVSAAREARRNGLRAAVEKESLWGVWKMQ